MLTKLDSGCNDLVHHHHYKVTNTVTTSVMQHLSWPAAHNPCLNQHSTGVIWYTSMADTRCPPSNVKASDLYCCHYALCCCCCCTTSSSPNLLPPTACQAGGRRAHGDSTELARPSSGTLHVNNRKWPNRAWMELAVLPGTESQAVAAAVQPAHTGQIIHTNFPAG